MSVLVVHGHRDRDPGISRECVRRVRAAERYAIHNPVSLVVFSGAGMDGWPSEAKQMAERFRLKRIPCVLEECSTSTWGNAMWTLALLGQWRVDTTELVVVSSWWHAPRTWLTWQACGARVRVVPSTGSWRYVAPELVPMARAVLGAIRRIGR